MAEAAFLARQKERLDLISRNRTEKLLKDEAMDQTKAEIIQWKHQLDETVALVEAQHPRNQDTSNTDFSLALSDLSESLKRLQQTCASNDLLSVSDTMLLHRQLTECQSQLSETMQRHRPKFIFRRYRQAMMEAQRQKEEATAGGVEIVKTAEKPSPTPPTKDNRCVIGISDAEIHITSSTGTVYIAPKSEGKESETRKLPTLHALEIANLSGCAVNLHGLYHSLILRNITDSTIEVLDSATTVHATQCHRVSFQTMRTQQIRLHQSDFVELRSLNATNVMLEDCQSIVIYSDKKSDDSSIQVNDFNWLRADQPSPNYTVVLSSSSSSSSVAVETSKQQKKAPSEPAESVPVGRSLDKVTDPELHAQERNNDGDVEPDGDDEL